MSETQPTHESATEPIWAPEELERFAHHARPQVRAWSLRRLALFAPAAAQAQAARCLCEPQPSVQAEALRVLEDAPCEGSYDALRASLEGGNLSGHLRARVEQLLLSEVQDPDALLRRLSAPTGSSDLRLWQALRGLAPDRCREPLLAATSAEMPRPDLLELLCGVAVPNDAALLLARASALGATDDQEVVLQALRAECDADDLTFEPEEGDLPAHLARLADDAPWWESVRTPLEALERAMHAERWTDALRAARELGAQLGAGPGGGPAALLRAIALSQELLRCVETSTESDRLAAELAYPLGVGLIRARRVCDALAAPTSTERLLSLRRRCSLPQRAWLDDELQRRWGLDAPQERALVLAALHSDLSLDVAPELHARASLLLALLPDANLAREVLDAITDEASENELDAALALLTSRPEALRAVAEARLGHTHVQADFALLSALAAQPFRWASRLVVERLDELLRSQPTCEILDACAELGDPSALSLLLCEWRPGEQPLAATLVFLATLGNREEELPDAIRREGEAHERKLEPSQHTALSFPTRELRTAPSWAADETFARARQPLPLDLRCNACGRTYTYEIKRLYLNPNLSDEPDRGIVLGQLIRCKRCGAEDDYELTTQAYGFTTLLLLQATRANAADAADDDDEGRVLLGSPQLWDGTPVRRPSQAAALLRTQAEARPHQALGWRRLGNLLLKFEELEAAESAFLRAVEVDATEAESPYALAGLLAQRRNAKEAMRWLNTAARRLPSSKTQGEARRALGQAIAHDLGHVIPQTEGPAGLTATWKQAVTEQKWVPASSSVDLRKLASWTALGEFLASPDTLSVSITGELPAPQDTLLARRLASPRTPEGTVVRTMPRVGRNDPCPCGSGKKYKKCCLA